MRISKITKLLPILLLFTAIPVFADDPVTASPVELAPYTLTLAEHIQLREKAGSNVKTATTSFIDDYEGLKLDAAMKAEFEVITNQPRKIKLTAVCPNGAQAIVPTMSTSGGTSTLSDVDGFSVVFSKTGSTDNENGIAAIVAGVAQDDDSNPDCFSIPVSLVVKRTLPEGDIADVGTTWDEGFVYQIANGTYDFTYTFAQAADQQTFSTHDSAGVYTATITMTDLGKI